MLDGAAGRRARSAWWSEVDLEALDGGSCLLLPQLYGWAVAEGLRGRVFERVRGAQRQAWLRNQVLFRELESAVRALRHDGIPTLLLKGVPLALLYYDRPASRPMADADVLVRREDAARARQRLLDLGWRRDQPGPYRHGAGLELDLHENAVPERPGLDEPWWAGARRMTLGETETLAPNGADLLLHVVAHGLDWNEAPPVRWVADAARILRAPAGEIDWDRLLAQARRFELLLPLSRGLLYVSRLSQIALPADVLAPLRAARPGWRERFESWLRARPREHPLLGHLPRLAHLYLSRRRHDPEMPPGFGAFLSAQLAAGPEPLPVVLARKARSRCARALRVLAR